MKYAFLATFIIASVIHLYASLKCDKKLRGITKPFLLLALLGWYLCSVESPLTIVVAAIITSWLGDVLLIPKGVKWFSVGGLSFFASHVCFIVAYAYHVNFAAIPVCISSFRCPALQRRSPSSVRCCSLRRTPRCSSSALRRTVS